MTRSGLLLERAPELRRAFDRSFSEPPVGATEDTESLLALRAGGNGYAIRLGEIAGLFADRMIVRLPSSRSEFLGVAGLRNEVIAVYRLESLLGHAPGGDRPRWLITARAAPKVAFAFEQFDGYLRVPPAAVLPSRDQAGSAHVSANVRLAEGGRGVLSVGSLLKTIEEHIRRGGTTKEQ